MVAAEFSTTNKTSSSVEATAGKSATGIAASGAWWSLPHAASSNHTARRIAIRVSRLELTANVIPGVGRRRARVEDLHLEVLVRVRARRRVREDLVALARASRGAR